MCKRIKMKTGRFILLLMLLLTFQTLVNAQTNWKTFVHHNGFSIQLPSYFKKGLLVASGTLQYFDNSRDSTISLTVESFGIGTTAELQTSYTSDLKMYEGISYKVNKGTWYVLSGQNSEGIFYNKSMIKNSLQYHLRINYPLSQKPLFDAILSRISSSFK